MLKHVLNQKQPPQPKKNPKIKPTQESRAQTHKNPCTHKTMRTNQNKATSTQQPPKTSMLTQRPTHHPMVNTRSPRANVPPPPMPTHDNSPEHKNPPSVHSRKSPCTSTKNKGTLTQINPALTTKQQMEDIAPAQKSIKNCRTDTAPLSPAHTIPCTQRPPRAQTEPPASLRQELPFSRESHSSVEKMF